MSSIDRVLVTGDAGFIGSFRVDVDYNKRSKATLLDVLVNKENDVKKPIVASSMSVYG